MLFNSLGFILFLLLVLLLYYPPVLKWTQKKGMLLLASYIFYGLWNPPLVLLLWISTFVDWTVGNLMYKTTDVRKRKLYLSVSIFVNLGFLGFFKYGGFLLENFTLLLNLMGVEFSPAQPDIILPMGISFYTFQTMSYSIDMYRKRIQPSRTFLDFALYVTFFPQLVAGPIVRSMDLIPQFYEPIKVKLDQFLWGAFLLTLGMFQKVVLADVMLADVADTIFGSNKLLNPLDSWTGTLAFSGQIFFDFAGYSTCAIGVALMLGIYIPDNFRFPYASIGFSEFWRRWHISLSLWLRDYLYIPLGGNRNGQVRTYINLMITMLLGGLWHGASWNFVFWGFLHGLYLGIERLLRSKVKLRVNYWNGIILAFATFTCVNITWVFFRASTFESATNMLNSMLLFPSEGEIILQQLDIVKVFVVVFGMFLCHWYMRFTSVKNVADKMPAWLLGFCWAVMIFLIVISQGSGEQFIYFQF